MNDFLKTYGGHLAAYLTSALALTSYASPTLFGSYGPLIVGIAGILAGAASNVHVATAPTVAPVTAKIAMWLMVATLSFAAGSGLTACKTAPTPTQTAGITVAVNIATGVAIQEGADSSVWKTRAANFKAIAVQIKTVNDAGTATLATLAADLAPLIAKLPPADQLAAHTLVAAVTPYINVEIAGNPQLQNAQATLDLILQAVIDSCATYGV